MAMAYRGYGRRSMLWNMIAKAEASAASKCHPNPPWIKDIFVGTSPLHLQLMADVIYYSLIKTLLVTNLVPPQLPTCGALRGPRSQCDALITPLFSLKSSRLSSIPVPRDSEYLIACLLVSSTTVAAGMSSYQCLKAGNQVGLSALGLILVFQLVCILV